MALNTIVRKVVYDGNGGPFPYVVPFKFFRDQHVKVMLQAPTGEEFEKTLGSDYIVTGRGKPSGGELRLFENLAEDWKILIFRSVAPYLQTTLFPAHGDFPPLTFEESLDLVHMALQELADGLGHSFSVSLFETITNTQDLQLLTKEALSVLGTDSSKNLTWYPLGSLPGGGGTAEGWHWKTTIGDKTKDIDHARNQLVNYGPFKRGDVLIVNAATNETIQMRDSYGTEIEAPGRLALVCFSSTGGSYWSNFFPIIPWADNRGYPQTGLGDWGWNIPPEPEPPPPDPIDPMPPWSAVTGPMWPIA